MKFRYGFISATDRKNMLRPPAHRGQAARRPLLRIQRDQDDPRLAVARQIPDEGEFRRRLGLRHEIENVGRNPVRRAPQPQDGRGAEHSGRENPSGREFLPSECHGPHQRK